MRGVLSPAVKRTMTQDKFLWRSAGESKYKNNQLCFQSQSSPEGIGLFLSLKPQSVLNVNYDCELFTVAAVFAVWC